MQSQKLYLTIFLLIGLLIVLTFRYISRSTKNPNPEWVVKKAYKFRGILFYVQMIVLFVLLFFTFSMLPYSKSNETPNLVIPVDAMMFSFDIKYPGTDSAGTGQKPYIPVNQLIEFRVSSKDVNHDFAIYSPKGDIIAQVQAMPGYVNVLRVKFTEPGVYSALCLEY